MDWFLYDRDLYHEKVKAASMHNPFLLLFNLLYFALYLFVSKIELRYFFDSPTMLIVSIFVETV